MSGESFTTAVERLDRALNRLDTSVRALSSRLRSAGRAETENRRLAGDLDRAVERAERLDQAAGEASRQIAEAMASVRAVLEQGELRG